MTKAKILLSTAMVGTLLATSQTAAAQTTPPAEPSAPAAQYSEGIVDIIVTARRHRLGRCAGCQQRRQQGKTAAAGKLHQRISSS